MAYCGHIRRMEPDRLQNMILTFQEKRKSQVSWVKEAHQDLEKCGVRIGDKGNREVLRKNQGEERRGRKDIFRRPRR